MSISSRITEIEQHIGNAYDKIEDLGIDLTDVDKNINNISAMLENVWEEYPKVSVSDVEEASINGTKKGKINIDLKGNTEQEQLSGKNLFDANAIGNSNITIENDGAKITLPISSAGGGAVSTGKKLSDLAPKLEVGQTYKLLMTATNNYINAGETWGNNGTKTITQSMLDSNVYMYSNSSSNVIVTNMMIVKESETDTNFEKYCRRNT